MFSSAHRSFKRYIKKESGLSNVRKQGYLSFLKFAKRLLDIAPNDITKLEQLQDLINQEQPVLKFWLLEKVAERLKKQATPN